MAKIHCFPALKTSAVVGGQSSCTYPQGHGIHRARSRTLQQVGGQTWHKEALGLIENRCLEFTHLLQCLAIKREKDRDREKQTDRQTDRKREREKRKPERERDRQTK